MITLRCTKRLLERMKARPETEPPPPTARLGDWYAHYLVFGCTQVVLAVSERSLLPVVIPAAPASTFVFRFLDAASEMMRVIGVPEEPWTNERREMDDVHIGRTANRQVLGTLNNFEYLLEAFLDGRSYHEAALHLASTPCSPIGMSYPREKALELLTK